MPIFTKDEDFIAFERVLEEAVARTGTRLLSYCLMGNHWHLVVWPREDDELSRFVGWLTLTHTQRWHAHRKSTGSGHLYQGRFKSFPVQDDDHFHTVSRYVERNAVRANLVKRAEDWRWSSLYRWYSGTTDEKALLSAWPLRRSAGWLYHVNAPQTDAELIAVSIGAHHLATTRGQPPRQRYWAWKSPIGLKADRGFKTTVPDTFSAPDNLTTQLRRREDRLSELIEVIINSKIFNTK
jgi:putative transposase